MLTPYYQDDFATLVHADWREIEGELPIADHLICDPPYAPLAMKNARSAASIKKRRDGKIYDFKYAAMTAELRHQTCLLASKKATRWSLVWCDIESAADWRSDLEREGLRYVRTGIWAREHSAPQFSGDRPAQGVEACVIVHTFTKLAWNGGGRPATWIGPIVGSQESSRVHTSPKPLWLMDAQIRDFTDPGELVLDPYGGSGTTAVACKRLGRRCVTVEVDERFCEAIADRLEATDLDERLVRVRDKRGKQAAMDFSDQIT